VDVGVQFNNGLEAIYTTAGSPVANVETAFSMSDFTIQPDASSTCSASANGR
jgi:hypothetical protein